MTREEAKKALKEGKKLTHPYFMEGEFVQMTENSSIMFADSLGQEVVQFEDGCLQSEKEFWGLRSNTQWSKGWEIIN